VGRLGCAGDAFGGRSDVDDAARAKQSEARLRSVARAWGLPCRFVGRLHARRCHCAPERGRRGV